MPKYQIIIVLSVLCYTYLYHYIFFILGKLLKISLVLGTCA